MISTEVMEYLNDNLKYLPEDMQRLVATYNDLEYKLAVVTAKLEVSDEVRIVRA